MKTDYQESPEEAYDRLRRSDEAMLSIFREYAKILEERCGSRSR